MIPADAGSKHAVTRTVRGHPGPQTVKKEIRHNIIYRYESVSWLGMILTDIPSRRESDTSSKQLTKEVTMYGYYDSGWCRQ